VPRWSQVVEKGHTLILGWNAATPRVVTEIAYLRSAWQNQNDAVWYRRWFSWAHLPPSSPLVHAPIVILSNALSKEDMCEELLAAISSAGVPPHKFRVGSDVVCRSGDPTNPHELVRVNAQHAIRVLMMLTDLDQESDEGTLGTTKNGVTLLGVLALRSVLLLAAESSMSTKNDWSRVVSAVDRTADEALNGSRHGHSSITSFSPLDDGKSDGSGNHHQKTMLKVIVQHNEPSLRINAAMLRAPDQTAIFQPLYITGFLNTVLFKTAMTEGKLGLIMSLFDFQGVAIRCRPAIDWGGTAKAANGKGLFPLIGLPFEEACETFEDSVLIGVTADAEGDGGLVCDRRRVVLPTDHVVFLSESSMPHGPMGTADQRSREEHDLSQLSLHHAEARVGGKAEPRNVLIVGWRAPWLAQDGPVTGATVMMHEIDDLSRDLAPGSVIVFLTTLEPDQFKTQMQRCGYERNTRDYETYRAEMLKKGREGSLDDRVDQVDGQKSQQSDDITARKSQDDQESFGEDRRLCGDTGQTQLPPLINHHSMKALASAVHAGNSAGHPGWWIGDHRPDVLVMHAHGDACLQNALQPCLEKYEFDVAIILNTTEVGACVARGGCCWHPQSVLTFYSLYRRSKWSRNIATFACSQCFSCSE
jgi:hypothetical protein